MEVSLSISSIIIIALNSVAVVLSIILSIALFIQKRKRHISIVLFCLLLLLTGLTLLNDMLTISGITNQFKDLYFIPIFYSLSIGPLFYLLVKSKVQHSIKSYDYIHLILPLIQAIIYFSIGFRSVAFKSYLWEETSFPIYLGIESFLFPLSLIGYSMVSRNLLLKENGRRHFWREDLKQWLLRFTNGILVIAIIEFCFSAADYLFSYSFGPVFLVVRSSTFVAFVLWIAFNGIKQYYPINIYQSRQTTSKALLTNESLANYSKALNKLMQDDKIYLNSDLNLEILARYLQTSEKICSHVLSNGLNSNFNQFVNGYRIEAFKKKILQGQHKQLTLSSLAYACGFDSKSTFNRSFKLANQMTPSQYVKSVQIS